MVFNRKKRSLFVILSGTKTNNSFYLYRLPDFTLGKAGGTSCAALRAARCNGRVMRRKPADER